MSESKDNFFVGVILGFILDMLIGYTLIGDIVAGAIAGFFANKSMLRGFLAGATAGSIGGLIILGIIYALYLFVVSYIPNLPDYVNLIFMVLLAIPTIFWIVNIILCGFGGVLGAWIARYVSEMEKQTSQ